MTRFVALLASALLAGCSQERAADAPPAAGETAPAPAATPAREAEAIPAERAFRFTSLENCPLVREEREELPYTEVLCAGPPGWALRIADSDARQTLGVVAPDGRETRIDLSGVSRGAFNSFGTTAEWRGPYAGRFAPDSLVVRFQVAEQPHPAPEVAYLLALRLVPEPCLVAKLPPGANQNASARKAADSGECALELTR